MTGRQALPSRTTDDHLMGSLRAAVALVGGPLAWLVTLGVIYAVQEVSCAQGWADDELWGARAVVWIGGAVAGVALLIALLVGLWSWRWLRRHPLDSRDGGGGAADDGPVHTGRSLAHAGMVTAGIAGVAIVLTAIAVIGTDACR